MYPIVPNGFADHYPYEKWLFHWEYTQHFQTYPYSSKPTFFGYTHYKSTINGHFQRKITMKSPPINDRSGTPEAPHHGGFRFGERQPCVRRAQGAAVVAAVAHHAGDHLVVTGDGTRWGPRLPR